VFNGGKLKPKIEKDTSFSSIGVLLTSCCASTRNNEKGYKGSEDFNPHKEKKSPNVDGKFE
jgi:hypothetical protein